MAAAPAQKQTEAKVRAGRLLLLLLGLFIVAVGLLTQRPNPHGSLPHVDAAVRIDVNVATASTLTLLPRIGPALAKRIVADREENGPFRSVADLDRVTGVGPKTVERLRDYATCAGAWPTTAISTPSR